MLETDLYDRVRTVCGTHRLFFQRFEDALQCGIPDMFVGPGITSDFRGTWVEGKITATPGAKPTFEKGQLAWAHTASQRGERVRTLIASPNPVVRGGEFYRVFDQAEIALSEAFGSEWPVTKYAGPSLEAALSLALGYRLREPYRTTLRNPKPAPEAAQPALEGIHAGG